MSTIILSALCAMALSTAYTTAPADTVNIYSVDYQKVENFDGSQLIGKKIESYNIDIFNDGMSGKVFRIHTVITDAAPEFNDEVNVVDDNVMVIGASQENPTIKVVSTTGEAPIFIVDGKQVSQDFISKLNPKKIDSMEILKGPLSDETAAKYGIPAGTSGVVLVYTKK
ncbi:MAG: hypothetical protein Q4G10_03185 [Bacteroidia bacterium]|nr:hypothetical protein [Bacteroidia bacterium]